MSDRLQEPLKRNPLKRLLGATSIVLVVCAVVQLAFAIVCAYMVAAINDDVWHGIKLDDLGETAGGVGIAFAFVSVFSIMFWTLIEEDGR